MNQWRLLVTPQKRGAINMALDSVIADSVAKGLSPPTIRFYDWNPYCLSIGFNQTISEIEYVSCQELGIDVARRPTGGRAVLHAKEFTYAVIIPAGNPVFRKSILGTYQIISDWLLEGLRKLGINAQQSEKRDRDSVNPDYEKFCFALPLRYEIMVNNRKLIGSAQRRFPGVVLQHGSILIGSEHLKAAKVFDNNQQARKMMEKYLQKHTACLEEFLCHIPDINDFAKMMSQIWEKMVQVSVHNGRISNSEMKAAESIQSKYSLLETEEFHINLNYQSQFIEVC